jgi:hypothetical protein
MDYRVKEAGVPRLRGVTGTALAASPVAGVPAFAARPAGRADEKRDVPRGFIIGKAMTRLETNKGLMLVLVQPQ